MATRFELVLCGDDSSRLRAAGEEALEEISRIEDQLSLYRPGSEIARINSHAAFEPVRVSPPVFELLGRAYRLFELTKGSFDVTVAPLVRCWGFMKGTGERPPGHEIENARASVGSNWIRFDENDRTISFRRPGMMIDLGSIGKGYAIDAAVGILRDAGVQNALLHGGTSTIFGLGVDPESGPWKIAVEGPPQGSEGQQQVLGVVMLQDRSLSVSGVWGKHFVVEGQRFGHVIDPRTGWPTLNGLLGAAIMNSAEESDALSTAILLGGQSELRELSNQLPQLKYLQIVEQQGWITNASEQFFK